VRPGGQRRTKRAIWGPDLPCPLLRFRGPPKISEMRKAEGKRKEKANTSRVASEPSRISMPTKREREVLQLLLLGKTSREIAAELNISMGTVGTHRANLMRKLRIHSASGLADYALKIGLLDK
jgi:DNA-binding NarL/FixJ family response regulator